MNVIVFPLVERTIMMPWTKEVNDSGPSQKHLLQVFRLKLKRKCSKKRLQVVQ